VKAYDERDLKCDMIHWLSQSGRQVDVAESQSYHNDAEPFVTDFTYGFSAYIVVNNEKSARLSVIHLPCASVEVVRILVVLGCTCCCTRYCGHVVTSRLVTWSLSI